MTGPGVAERGDDFEDAVRSAVRERQAALWTSLPATVVKYNSVKQTADVQPTVQAYPPGADGMGDPVNMPVCLDCPICYPRGGGYALTFPLAPGDEVLVVFASRCIDAWWQSGGVQPQAEMRMHDLSDGFVIPGPTSRPAKIANLTPDAMDMRSIDGKVFTRTYGYGLASILNGTVIADITKGGISTPGHVSGGSMFSGGWTTPTGDVMTVVNGALAFGNGILNPSYLTSVSDRVRSAVSCDHLQKIVDQEIGGIYAANTDLLAKAAALNAVISLITHPSDPLTWINSFIDKFLGPQLAAAAKIATQVAGTASAVANISTAVNDAKARFTSCSITLPTP